MTLRQIIENEQLPIKTKDHRIMSFLGIYIRDEIFGPGNPTPLNKVEENDNKVIDYPDELRVHVVNLIREAIKKNPKWSTAKKTFR